MYKCIDSGSKKNERTPPKLLGVVFGEGEYLLSEDLELTYNLYNWLWNVQRLSAGERSSRTMNFRLRDKDGNILERRVDIDICGDNDYTAVESFAHELSLTGEHSAAGNALWGCKAGDGYYYQHSFAWTTAAATAKYGTATQHSFAWISQSTDAVYGEVTLNDDGSYSYRLKNGERPVQALRPDEVAEDVFEYSYTDANGDEANGTVTIKITGTIDHPSLEDISITFSLADPDIKEGDAMISCIPGDGDDTEYAFSWITPPVHAQYGTGISCSTAYGTVRLFENGRYEYTVDTSNPNYTALTSTAQEVFTFSVSDGYAFVSGGCVTINVLPRTPD